MELAAVVDAANLPERTRVYADKGYTSKKNSEELQARHLKDGIMGKACRNRTLSAREQKRNRLISGVRSIVERSFGTLKQTYGLARASYMGMPRLKENFYSVP